MHRSIVLAVVFVAACATPVPPPPAPQARPAVPVTASFAKTWQSAVDVFADKNVGIRTIDRSSGLIVADPVSVPFNVRELSKPGGLADCGRDMLAHYVPPSLAVYNVRVRGDSTSSSVLVTVRWTTTLSNAANKEVVCASTGAWEENFEKAVKDKAEGRGP
jgi:hypothetical protein